MEKDDDEYVRVNRNRTVGQYEKRLERHMRGIHWKDEDEKMERHKELVGKNEVGSE